MTNEYSVLIHEYLIEKITLAEQKKKTAEKTGRTEVGRFHDGQLSELFKIRAYLSEKIDLKTQKYY